MKIDIGKAPEQDIFRNKKKYILWFIFFLVLVCTAIGLGVYSVYSTSEHVINLEDWSLGILVASAVGVTVFGNKLQAYKALFPPQREKLDALRAQHSVIDTYCSQVDTLQRRYIRAEYEACVEYAEIQETEQEKAGQAGSAVYGPAENPNKDRQ